MSVLSNSQSLNLRLFSDDQGGPMELGHYTIVKALAELAGVMPMPTTAGALPTPTAFIPVQPAVGAVGLVSLATFTDGDAPFTAPTIGPKYHGAKSLILTAPATNGDTIYFAQNDAVRPLGATTAILGPEKITNNTFATTMTGWTASGDIAFISDTPGAYFTTNEITAGQGVLEQSIANLPPGTYALLAVPATLFATSGSVVLSVQVNGVEVLQFTGDGDTTVDVEHGGGTLNLKLVLTIADNADDSASCLITSVSLKRSDTAAANVGTPLPAGESIILLARDMDLTRGLYVVPTIGEAADKVIANFQY